MNTKLRNTGIDLLRILSMFLIVILHTLNQGGVLAASAKEPSMYRVAMLFEVITYCCVDCYALISGYVGVNSKNRISRILALWLQVVFYTIVITAIFSIMMPAKVNLHIWFKALLPVMSREYWYITCYFGILLFTPFINAGINHMPRKQLLFIAVAIVAMLSMMPVVVKFYPINFYDGLDTFGLAGGYSVIWLLALYILGALYRKNQERIKMNKIVAISLICTIVLATWLAHIFMPVWTMRRFGEERYTGLWVGYTAPGILAISVLLLILFSNMASKAGKVSFVVSILGKASLGVYLIHTHPLIWDTYINQYATSYADGSVGMMVCKVLGSSVVIFSVCILIELIRMGVFKIIRIDKLCEKVSKVLEISNQ